MTERNVDQPFEFDGQAHAFDARAGLPLAVCNAIADALLRLSPPQHAGALLELGAGTGQIGALLAARDPQYVGMDLSAPMLAQFRARAPEPAVQLLQADANASWPLSTGSVRMCFMSRAAHLFDPTHMHRQLMRVRRRDGVVVAVGRVERDRDDPRAQLRRQMRQRLRDSGRQLRGGDGGYLQRLAMVAASDAVVEPSSSTSGSSRGQIHVQVVAHVPVETTLQTMLDSWRHKSGLAGAAISAADKAQLLDELALWASERLGDLNAPQRGQERYVLESLRIEGAE